MAIELVVGNRPEHFDAADEIEIFYLAVNPELVISSVVGVSDQHELQWRTADRPQAANEVD